MKLSVSSTSMVSNCSSSPPSFLQLRPSPLTPSTLSLQHVLHPPLPPPPFSSPCSLPLGPFHDASLLDPPDLLPSTLLLLAPLPPNSLLHPRSGFHPRFSLGGCHHHGSSSRLSDVGRKGRVRSHASSDGWKDVQSEGFQQRFL